MDKMVQILMEEEKRLIKKETLLETSYRSPMIDIDALLSSGYISADDYRKSRQS